MSGLELSAKEQLIGQINKVKNSFILGLASVTLLSNKEVRYLVDIGSVPLGDARIDFPNLSKWIDENEKEITDLISCHLRLLVGDSFELIDAYCGRTKQRATLKDQDWYIFAYKIRSIFYHGGKIGCRSRGEEVKWNEVVITQELNGKYLSLEVMSHKKGWQLFVEMEKFVHDVL